MTTNTNAALRSAAESALEALEILNGIDTETESVTIHVSDEIAALRAALTAAAAPAAVAGPKEAVAYLDIGEGGYLDLGSDLSDEALKKLPKGRHMLAIVGTYGMDGYVPVAAPTTQATPQPAVQQGDELPREDFAWLVVQEACETEPADEDDPECIRILRRDLKSAVLSAFLRHDAAHPAAPVAQGDAREETNIGKAVNRAARDLPEGWEIRIDLERHAGVVHLIDPEGNETMIEGGGELFSDQISTAIDAARSQAKEGA